MDTHATTASTNRAAWNVELNIKPKITEKKLEEPAKCANCGENHTVKPKDAKPLKKILSRIKSKTGTTKIVHQHIQTYAVPPPLHISGHDALRSNPKEKHSYAEATANTIPSDQPLKIIISFLNELKSVLNPLLTALTCLINKCPLPITPTP